MKKHNLFKVVMITFGVVVLLSWIFDITTISSYGGVTESVKVPIGLFNIMNNVSIAVQYFGHIGIYVLIVGGLYGVLHKIPGYRNLIDKLVKGFTGYEWIFMIISMLIFTLLTSMAGFSPSVILFFPFVIAVILAMGYDKITASMVTIGSVSVGLIGTVFSSNNIIGLNAVLGTNANDYVISKVVILVISFAILVFNVLWYARNHKNGQKDLEGSYIPEKSADSKQKVWPIVVLMDALLVFLVLAFISWDLFEVSFFKDIHTRLIEYTIFDFPLFKNLFALQDGVYFGNWSVIESSIFIIITSMLVAFIYRMRINDYITNFMNGSKRALKAAALVVLSYIVLVGITNVPTLLTIFKPMFDLTADKMNVFTMSIASFVTSLFDGDAYYGAIAILPYVTNVQYTSASYELLSLIFQSMYGLAMLVAPVSVVLLAVLSYLHIPYGTWLKSIWKLLLELFVVLMIILFIVAAII